MKDRLYTAAEVQAIVDDTLMSVLHPEFGTAWREGDGEFWLATESLRQRIDEQAETIARVRVVYRKACERSAMPNGWTTDDWDDFTEGVLHDLSAALDTVLK